MLDNPAFSTYHPPTFLAALISPHTRIHREDHRQTSISALCHATSACQSSADQVTPSSAVHMGLYMFICV